MLLSQKEKLNAWFRLKLEESLAKMLHKIPILIKKNKDPHMFEFIKNLVDDIVDDTWPDIEEEILYQIDLKLLVPYISEILGEKSVHWLCYPCNRFKAWYIYSNYPCKFYFKKNIQIIYFR